MVCRFPSPCHYQRGEGFLLSPRGQKGRHHLTAYRRSRAAGGGARQYFRILYAQADHPPGGNLRLLQLRR